VAGEDVGGVEGFGGAEARVQIERAEEGADEGRGGRFRGYASGAAAGVGGWGGGRGGAVGAGDFIAEVVVVDGAGGHASAPGLLFGVRPVD